LEELTAYWDELFPQCVAPDPEALPTLRRLRERGVALGLIAPGWPDMQRAKIATLGLDGLFAVTLLAGESGANRWDAHVYRRAAEMLGLAPVEIWMVSALQEECQFARDAGVGVIFLQRTFYWPRDAEPPVYEIATLGELVALLSGDTH
jgi:FMN phosphatase YigB (HAD superfamily)